MKIGILTAAILLGVSAPALAQDVAVQVKEDKGGLLAQATVKPDSARMIALAQVPGGKITDAEIEEEDGRLVYEFEIESQGEKREIHVDAKTAEVVTFEHQDDAAMGAGLKEDEPGLLAQATVKPDSAEKIALASVPGGRIVKREIEREDGKLVYTFDIEVAGQPRKEVLVDAATGALIEAKKE
jgi:uncharacterized membrane protein YkoI